MLTVINNTMVINKNVSKIYKFFIEIFVGTNCMSLSCHIRVSE